MTIMYSNILNSFMICSIKLNKIMFIHLQYKYSII